MNQEKKADLIIVKLAVHEQVLLEKSRISQILSVLSRVLQNLTTFLFLTSLPYIKTVVPG